MPQFTVYQNKNLESKKTFPLLLDVQSNLLESMQTTVVIPLCKLATSKEKLIAQLTPVLSIEGISFMVLTPQLAGIHRKELGKAVVNVDFARTEIINAVDFLLTGI